MKEKLKEELLTYLNEALELLRKCGRAADADLYQKKLERLKTLETFSKDFLKEIKKISIDFSGVGMGFFFELGLYPNGDSGLSYEEAQKRQIILIEKIGETIKKLSKIVRLE